MSISESAERIELIELSSPAAGLGHHAETVNERGSLLDGREEGRGGLAGEGNPPSSKKGQWGKERLTTTIVWNLLIFTCSSAPVSRQRRLRIVHLACLRVVSARAPASFNGRARSTAR